MVQAKNNYQGQRRAEPLPPPVLPLPLMMLGGVAGIGALFVDGALAFGASMVALTLSVTYLALKIRRNRSEAAASAERKAGQ